MSLDFYLTKKVMASVFDSNMTHNLTTMADACGIYRCLWRAKEDGFKYASQLIPLLTDALVQLKEKPSHFRQFDSPNGWGTYGHFVPWVESILVACKEHPDAEIETSR